MRETGITLLFHESMQSFDTILTFKYHNTGSARSDRGTIIFLHGAPTQSYSYRVVMSQV